MWEMWYRKVRICPPTHAHTHTDTIFVFVLRRKRSNFSWAQLPGPHSNRACESNLVSCSLPSLRRSGGTGNGKANPISFLGTQPGQMESAVACYLLPATCNPDPRPRTKKRARLRNKSSLRAHTLATMAVLTLICHWSPASPAPAQPLPWPRSCAGGWGVKWT